MRVIKAAIAAAVVFSLSYLAGAFFAWNFNAGEWTEGLRFSVLAFGMPAAGLVFVASLSGDFA